MYTQKIRGFTLIELLVVIAIIALLLSILMPSLKMAKKVAQAVTCRSNLKQIGLASRLYAEDNDNFIPRNGGKWMWFFMQYLGNTSDRQADFIKLPVYQCPSYPEKNQMVDYVINSWKDGVTESVDSKGKTRISDFDNPSAKVYLADNAYYPGRPIVKVDGTIPGVGSFDVWLEKHLPLGGDGQRRAALNRHKDGCNFMFMDGHSGWISAEDCTPRYWQPKRW